MENLIVASPISVFSLFGWGFLCGSLFAFVVMLTFEWITHISRKAGQREF